MTPQISVLIATHNNELTIAKAVASVQTQRIADIEIIVVNDASTDKTYDVVAELAAQDSRIKCVNLTRNVGASGARNRALASARGEYVSILDGDDWYDPSRLDVLLKTARERDADMVADNIKIYDHATRKIIFQTNYGESNKVSRLTVEGFFHRDNSLQEYPIGYIQPLIRRSFLESQKIVYDETYRVGEDFIFEAEILLKGARAFIVPGAYYNYIHSVSPTSKRSAPDSHSNIPLQLSTLIRGGEYILRRYGATMSSEAQNALLLRGRLLEGSTMLRNMREALRRFYLFEAVKIAIGNPIVLLLIAHNLKELLAANARALHLELVMLLGLDGSSARETSQPQQDR